MSKIIGLNGAEIIMLQKWASIHFGTVVISPPTDEDCFADIYSMRLQWSRAGGNFPVTETQVRTLQPAPLPEA